MLNISHISIKREDAVMNGSAKRRMLERFDLSMPAVIMSKKGTEK